MNRERICLRRDDCAGFNGPALIIQRRGSLECFVASPYFGPELASRELMEIVEGRRAFFGANLPIAAGDWNRIGDISRERSSGPALADPRHVTLFPSVQLRPNPMTALNPLWL